MITALCEALRQRTQQGHSRISDPEKLWTINVILSHSFVWYVMQHNTMNTQDNTKSFSMVVVIIYTSTIREWKLPILHVRTVTCCLNFKCVSIGWVQNNILVIFYFAFPHLLMRPSIFSYVYKLFKCIFYETSVFYLLCIILPFLYFFLWLDQFSNILDTNPLSVMCDANSSPHLCLTLQSLWYLLVRRTVNKFNIVKFIYPFLYL